MSYVIIAGVILIHIAFILYSVFIYKEHKDWLLKDKDGKIIMEWEHDYHGGGSVHVLDSSHPEAFEYLRKVFKQMRAWGVTTYKTDFSHFR